MQAVPPHEIEREICSFVTSLTGRACAPHDDLKAIGIDSIAFLELVIFLEKRLAIPLPLELITAQPITTISGLTVQLASLLPVQRDTNA